METGLIDGLALEGFDVRDFACLDVERGDEEIIRVNLGVDVVLEG